MANTGLTSEILDGKLSPKITLPEDVVLIVDRAYSGPSNVLYSVSDSDKAKVIYGATSPIIQSMRHAFAGGAKNVALYRIGGGSAKVNNLFGPYTVLATTEETVSAGTSLSVYAGPRVGDATKSCIIVYNGNKVVYSNVPGKEINLSVVKVEGFDPSTFPYQVGTISEPVAFASILTAIKQKGSETFTASASQTAFTLTAPVSSVTKVTKTVSGVTTTLALTTDYTVTSASGNVTGITLVSGASSGTVIEVFTLRSMTSQEKLDNELSYEAGKDSMTSNLNKLYELYDTAFIELETVDAFSIIIDDLFDARNIAAGADSSADRLTYLSRSETEDGFKYEWSSNKTLYQLASDPSETTTDVDLAAIDGNGIPVISKQYNEVDFAHRLATWCWTQSSSATYVNGCIGSRGPLANYQIAINRWVGKQPTTDIYGTIIENGSGLLGNRFMAGTTTRKAGYYLTDTGYPDGNPKYDSSNVVVDIGKYLSLPPIPVYITTENSTGNKIYTRSSAAAYSGLVTQIAPGDSTTNQVLPNVTAPFKLKGSQIRALSDLGYVVLEEKNKGLTVYSGDLATQSASDYDYISTAISVSYILSRLRIVVDPYIGKGLSDALLAALYNAIDVELKNSIKNGYINGYNFNLVSAGPHDLQLPLTLVAKEELRSISITLSLAENTAFSI